MQRSKPKVIEARVKLRARYSAVHGPSGMLNQHRCMAFKDRSRSSTLDRVAYVRGRVRNGDEINSVLYLMTDGNRHGRTCTGEKVHRDRSISGGMGSKKPGTNAM